MNTPKNIGPLTSFRWGWSLSLPFVWLTWSRCDSHRKLYVSRDGTPVKTDGGRWNATMLWMGP